MNGSLFLDDRMVFVTFLPRILWVPQGQTILNHFEGFSLIRQTFLRKGRKEMVARQRDKRRVFIVGSLGWTSLGIWAAAMILCMGSETLQIVKK